MPNVFFDKQARRKNDYMKLPMNDGANIEYEKIFPQILSSNRKAANYVRLDKMTERSRIYKDMAGAPDYTVNYSLVDIKPKVTLFDRSSNLSLTRAL